MNSNWKINKIVLECIADPYAPWRLSIDEGFADGSMKGYRAPRESGRYETREEALSALRECLSRGIAP